MLMAPNDALYQLPMGEAEAASFFYGEGRRRGYVKGSKKPFERLFMSWWAFDSYIGRDKAFGPADETGTIFYTSAKFWQRRASDMWAFADFLRFYGWDL